MRNSQTASQSGTLVSSTKGEERKRRVPGDRKLVSDISASSSDRVKPVNGTTRHTSVAHTEPVKGTVYTDDTDNDITTDSDMAQTEVDEKRSGSTRLLKDIASKKQETLASRPNRTRPTSAQDRRRVPREHTSSRDRHTSRENARSRDRHRSRDRVISRERDIPSLPLDRQEPDGRSSRQGRVEDKSDSKGSVGPSSHTSSHRQSRKESESRRSGQSLDRGNNTGSSEPPTVIEVGSQ